MKISVLCFDLADNAAGRAYLLASLLAPLGEVKIVGPCSPAGIWPPVAGEPMQYATAPDRRWPGFVSTARALLGLADGDLIYASKTRLASAGIGYLKRLASHRPLVLDIDDWEVGFFLRSGVRGAMGRALNLGNPAGLPWTWLMERCTGLADAISVSSRFLQQRFGGLLLPHVRDTDAWRPGRVSGSPARQRLGVGQERLVLFLGTPRAHKGVQDLAEAVGRLARRDIVLALVGADRDKPDIGRLDTLCPGMRVLGPVAFTEVPAFLEAADVVAIPQRQSIDTRGQVPAKLFDAMALGRPIVSTRVSMIPEILDGCGMLVDPGDVAGLARAIEHLADHPTEARRLGEQARRRCEERYSFAAARQALFPILQRIMRTRCISR